MTSLYTIGIWLIGITMIGVAILGYAEGQKLQPDQLQLSIYGGLMVFLLLFGSWFIRRAVKHVSEAKKREDRRYYERRKK